MSSVSSAEHSHGEEERGREGNENSEEELISSQIPEADKTRGEETSEESTPLVVTNQTQPEQTREEVENSETLLECEASDKSETSKNHTPPEESKDLERTDVSNDAESVSQEIETVDTETDEEPVEHEEEADDVVEVSFQSATEAGVEDFQTVYEEITDHEMDENSEADADPEKYSDSDHEQKIDEATDTGELPLTGEATFGLEVIPENTVTQEECVRIDIPPDNCIPIEDLASEERVRKGLIPIATRSMPSVTSDATQQASITLQKQEISTDPEEAPSELTLPTTPNKDARTYERAQERMRLIMEEQDKQLYLKKNVWTTMFLGWQRFKKMFQFSLWATRIQAVEGKHGSNVGLTMYFLRWTLYLNLVISIIWLIMTVVPFVAYPPPTYSWNIFTERNATEFLSGNALGETWFLYGGFDYAKSVTRGGLFEPGIAFPLATCLALFLSLVSLLNVIGKRISVVFASWDFHMEDIASVGNLKNAIRSQIREMLHDAEWSQKTITWQEQFLNGTTKIIGTVVFWPATLILTASAMFYAVGNGDIINEYFGFSFAQSITITLVSLAGQVVVRSTVKYEGWHPRVAQQVETTKLFSVKVINLAIILYRIYDIQQKAANATDQLLEQGIEGFATCDVSKVDSCEIGLTCCDRECSKRFNQNYQGRCIPVCEENVMGMIFYRLILTNGFILSLQEVVQAFMMTYCFRKPPQMDAAKFFVNIVDTQAIVWLGSIVAPLLPLFGVLSNVTMFYVKTWLALTIYDPPMTTCSASRNSNMQYNLTLVALLFSALPVTSLLYESRDICGPNPGQSMADALSKRIRRAPPIVKTLIRWVTNPIILGGALFILTFFFLLERVHKAKWQNKAQESEIEFSRYRHDMQMKLAETRSKAGSPVSASHLRSPTLFDETKLLSA